MVGEKNSFRLRAHIPTDILTDIQTLVRPLLGTHDVIEQLRVGSQEFADW